MKIRSGFVTNSSSSSYIVVYSVNDTPELQDFVKEEFGNHGIRDFKMSMKSGKEIKDEIVNYYGYDDLDEYDENINKTIEDEEQYLYGYKVSRTTEGAESDSIFDIIRNLPEGSCKFIYEGECD